MPKLHPVVLPLLLIAASLFFLIGAGEWLLASLGLDRLDRAAGEVVRGVMLRAGAAFAVSKTINAALSFAQEITVSGSLFVAGGSFSPARFLEPVNNLVDQFALVMLAVAAAAAALDILLTIGTAWGGALLLPAGLVLLAARLGCRRRGWAAAERLGRLGTGLVLLALVLRLALPAALALTGTISERFMEERFARASAGLELVERRAEDAASEAVRLEEAAAEPGFVERWFGGAGDAAATVTRATSALSLVTDNFDDLFDHVVTLVTVFLLETVVLPLLLVWLAARGLAVLVTPRRTIRPDEPL